MLHVACTMVPYRSRRADGGRPHDGSASCRERCSRLGIREDDERAAYCLASITLQSFNNLINSTLLSSLNIVGNIIGSGTALTNLNYNSITNRPDLTVYAANTNLNSLSTNSTL